MRETIGLQPGLIVLRYKKGTSRQNARIRPTVSERSRQDVEIISDPLKTDLVLDQPGDCVVLRCLRPASVHIDVSSKHQGQQARGSVVVEYLTSAKQTDELGESTRSAGNVLKKASDAPKIRYLGHVSYWGDTWVPENTWIGGPERPMPLEGLQLDTSATPDLDITLKDIRTGAVIADGDFLGTRGKSIPLNGLELVMSEQSAPFEIKAEALFRDAGLCEATGKTVALVGNGYQDVLLGLRIAVLESSAASPGLSGDPGADVVEDRPNDPGNAPKERVKIFRK